MEKEFWNKKYREGGISGRGSLGLYRNWKWNKIRKTIGLDFNSLIDVGCGDLRFWDHPHGKSVFKQRIFKYVGIDISEEIIERNRKAKPDFMFYCQPAQVQISGISSQIVFCLDLLFHIMNDGEFEVILENCCRYTNQFLIIYTWQRNPFEGSDTVTDEISNYYRHLSDYRHIFNHNDLELWAEFEVPYDPYGKLYFFRRQLY
jgi:2-polyprenyl-3-methyl-5-hydroxy-6-metoxy-1,4-benzoquinol methylase